jgi:hypothetical protein
MTQLPTVAESPRTVSDPDGHEVVGGVDTHKDTHTAAAIDERGRLLGCAQFPATPAATRTCWPGYAATPAQTAGCWSGWKAPAPTAPA